MERIITIIIIALIIATVMCHNFIFASYNNKVTEQDLCERVKNVFYERTKIWNNFLIGQYASLSQLGRELGEIVTDPLLESDMKMYKQMSIIPTSHERISDISIEKIHVIENNPQNAILEISILWEVEGYENNYNEEIGYIIEMKKNRENWMLSNYTVNKQ